MLTYLGFMHACICICIFSCAPVHCKQTSKQTRIYHLSSLFLLFCIHLSQTGLLNTSVSTSSLSRICDFRTLTRFPMDLIYLKYSAKENKWVYGENNNALKHTFLLCLPQFWSCSVGAFSRKRVSLCYRSFPVRKEYFRIVFFHLVSFASLVGWEWQSYH